MPLFGFLCKACGAESEVLVRAQETPKCVHCGSTRLEKQASHFAAVASSGAPEPMGCGAPSCCRMQGGGCPN